MCAGHKTHGLHAWRREDSPARQKTFLEELQDDDPFLSSYDSDIHRLNQTLTSSEESGMSSLEVRCKETPQHAVLLWLSHSAQWSVHFEAQLDVHRAKRKLCVAELSSIRSNYVVPLQ